jgi:fermentation-respiration switch protein FrsA (DUF1100 family)
MIVIAYLVGAYVLVCALVVVFQNRLVFFPDRQIRATPQAIGLSYRDIDFSAEDGTRLHGWYVPAAVDAPILIFCHGNAGNISDRLDSIRIFHELGLSVFIFDYRGYGRSSGRITERGTVLDARGAWRYLVETEGHQPERLVYFGRSLGGSVAIDLASWQLPRAIIVESCFPSMVEMGARVYPWLPVRLLARIRYDSRAKITTLQCRKLFIHSQDDEIVPYDLGRRLFDLASSPKEFLTLRGRHNDGFLVDQSRYRAGVAAFLNE